MKQEPIYQRRKPGLGVYFGNRESWYLAWRAARIGVRNGSKPDPKDKGLLWKASLIAAYERQEHNDPLSLPAKIRLEALRMVNEIIAGR